MTQISRQHADTIASGLLAKASDINDELNVEVNESNSQDTRLTALESGTATISGAKTYSGTSTFSGAVNLASHVNMARAGDQGSPAEGDIWYNTTSNVWKVQRDASTLT